MFWKPNYFIQDFYKKHGPFKKMLDVGSRNINGVALDSVIAVSQKEGWQLPEHTGIDFLEGKNVDIVLNGHDVEQYFGQDSFDLVTCTETLEHDEEFWKTVEAMRNVVKPGGWLLITVPGPYFFIHDYPGDYYRFTEQAVKKMFENWKNVYIEVFQDPNDNGVPGKANMSILAYGQKP